MPRALRDAVRPEREREPADERRRGGQPELPQPYEANAPAATRSSSRNKFHASTVPEQRVERPVRQPERPAAEVPARGLSGWKVYGSSHGASTVLQLVSDEPEVVLGLEVVARAPPAGNRGTAREEARVRVLERRPGRDERGAEVEREG